MIILEGLLHILANINVQVGWDVVFLIGGVGLLQFLDPNV